MRRHTWRGTPFVGLPFAGLGPEARGGTHDIFSPCHDRGGSCSRRNGGERADHDYHTREPVESRTVVTTEPLDLTPVQRQTIYRTIVREQVVRTAPTVEYHVGARVPDSVRLYSVPREVAVEVPTIRSYKYMVVNNRVVLVDPATSQVVEEVVD